MRLQPSWKRARTRGFQAGLRRRDKWICRAGAFAAACAPAAHATHSYTNATGRPRLPRPGARAVPERLRPRIFRPTARPHGRQGQCAPQYRSTGGPARGARAFPVEDRRCRVSSRARSSRTSRNSGVARSAVRRPCARSARSKPGWSHGARSRCPAAERRLRRPRLRYREARRARDRLEWSGT